MTTGRVTSIRIREGRGQLTESQRERILHMSKAGWNNKEIAREFGCCEETVSRLRVKARAEALAA